jgi:hypothetical protein
MDNDDSVAAEIEFHSVHRGETWCEGCDAWRPEAGAVDGLCASCVAEPEPAEGMAA